MLKKVARAICRAGSRLDRERCFTCNGRGTEGCTEWDERQARAALEALREPSKEMVRAIDTAAHDHWPDAKKMAVALWAAGINAALEEQP